MLHDLALRSAEHILKTLQSQLKKCVEIKDLVQPIPEELEDQEKVLDELMHTVQYTPSHADRVSSRVASRSQVMTPTRSRANMTPLVS